MIIKPTVHLAVFDYWPLTSILIFFYHSHVMGKAKRFLPLCKWKFLNRTTHSTTKRPKCNTSVNIPSRVFELLSIVTCLASHFLNFLGRHVLKSVVGPWVGIQFNKWEYVIIIWGWYFWIRHWIFFVWFLNSFGYIPNIDLMQFLSVATSGAYLCKTPPVCIAEIINTSFLISI